MDNWYTGVPLVSTLMQQGIAVVGTVRSNRLKGCVLSNDKVIRQKNRGSSEVKTCEIDDIELRAIRWFDKCVVTIKPSTKVKRWDQKNGQEIEVDCPSAVVNYDQNMGGGGVDLLDGLLSYYRIPVKSKKWYHCLIWHFFRYCCCSGLYFAEKGHWRCYLNLKAFKISVAMSLIKQVKSTRVKRGRPSLSIEKAYESKKARGPTASIPNVSIRTDLYEHFPVYSDKQERCQKPDCQGYTSVHCSKCDVRLCFTRSSNCFKEFHDS